MADKTLRFLVVILTLFSIWVVVKNGSERYKVNKNYEFEINKLKDSIRILENKKDSLYAELYPCEIETNRFHIAFRILEERNPKAAEELGDIISDETE
jgi:hypothetical protein